MAPRGTVRDGAPRAAAAGGRRVAGAESAHRRGGFGDLGCSGAVRTTADVHRHRRDRHHGMTARRSGMDDWWSVDDEILACLAVNPYLTPAELGHKLGMSEPATSSLLALLAKGPVVIYTAIQVFTPT